MCCFIGGPLLDVKSGALVGIISTGIGCARHGLPGIYIRVSKFTQWITEQVNWIYGCVIINFLVKWELLNYNYNNSSYKKATMSVCNANFFSIIAVNFENYSNFSQPNFHSKSFSRHVSIKSSPPLHPNLINCSTAIKSFLRSWLSFEKYRVHILWSNHCQIWFLLH